MTCPTCAERRRKLLEAWQNRQIVEAVRQAALGAAEMVGVVNRECAHEFMRQQPNGYGGYYYECPQCGVSGTRPAPWADGQPL